MQPDWVELFVTAGVTAIVVIAFALMSDESGEG